MIEVHVVRHWEDTSYHVYVVDRRSESRWLMEENGQWRELPPASVAEGPTWRIPDTVAHALLGSLSTALGSVEHPQRLRDDFEHERERRELLENHLLETLRLLVRPTIHASLNA